MKLINNTDYESRDLYSLFMVCCERAPVDIKTRKLDVIVKHSRISHSTGKAFLGKIRILGKSRYCITIRIPEPIFFKHNRTFLTREIAWLFTHELFHCAGIKHKEMRGNYFYKYWVSPWNDHSLKRLYWADNLELRFKETG